MELLQKQKSDDYNPQLHHLACKPQTHCFYTQCDVSGTKYVIEERDRKMKTQNSGVMVQTVDETYYGILEDIIELRYRTGMAVVVFKCRWFNTDRSERGNVKVDHGLISVHTSTSWYTEAPFCVASTVRQVFYIDDPDPKAGDNWKVVNVVSPRGAYNANLIGLDEDDMAYQEATIRNSPQVPVASIKIDIGFLPVVPRHSNIMEDENILHGSEHEEEEEEEEQQEQEVEEVEEEEEEEEDDDNDNAHNPDVGQEDEYDAEGDGLCECLLDNISLTFI